MSYSDVKAFCKDLWGLALNGSPRWRILVMFSIVFLSAATAWGYANYARASALEQTTNGLTDIKAQLLAQSILAAHKEKCESERAGRYSSYWQEHLSRLRNEYWKLTGQSFELPPSC